MAGRAALALPPELVDQVFGYLPLASRAAACGVSRAFVQVFEGDCGFESAWKARWQQLELSTDEDSDGCDVQSEQVPLVCLALSHLSMPQFIEALSTKFQACPVGQINAYSVLRDASAAWKWALMHQEDFLDKCAWIAAQFIGQQDAKNASSSERRSYSDSDALARLLTRGDGWRNKTDKFECLVADKLLARCLADGLIDANAQICCSQNVLQHLSDPESILCFLRKGIDVSSSDCIDGWPQYWMSISRGCACSFTEEETAQYESQFDVYGQKLESENGQPRAPQHPRQGRCRSSPYHRLTVAQLTETWHHIKRLMESEDRNYYSFKNGRWIGGVNLCPIIKIFFERYFHENYNPHSAGSPTEDIGLAVDIASDSTFKKRLEKAYKKIEAKKLNQFSFSFGGFGSSNLKNNNNDDDDDDNDNEEEAGRHNNHEDEDMDSEAAAEKRRQELLCDIFEADKSSMLEHGLHRRISIECVLADGSSVELLKSSAVDMTKHSLLEVISQCSDIPDDIKDSFITATADDTPYSLIACGGPAVFFRGHLVDKVHDSTLFGLHLQHRFAMSAASKSSNWKVHIVSASHAGVQLLRILLNNSSCSLQDQEFKELFARAASGLFNSIPSTYPARHSLQDLCQLAISAMLAHARVRGIDAAPDAIAEAASFMTSSSYQPNDCVVQLGSVLHSILSDSEFLASPIAYEDFAEACAAALEDASASHYLVQNWRSLFCDTILLQLITTLQSYDLAQEVDDSHAVAIPSVFGASNSDTDALMKLLTVAFAKAMKGQMSATDFDFIQKGNWVNSEISDFSPLVLNCFHHEESACLVPFALDILRSNSSMYVSSVALNDLLFDAIRANRLEEAKALLASPEPYWDHQQNCSNLLHCVAESGSCHMSSLVLSTIRSVLSDEEKYTALLNRLSSQQNMEELTPSEYAAHLQFMELSAVLADPFVSASAASLTVDVSMSVESKKEEPASPSPMSPSAIASSVLSKVGNIARSVLSTVLGRNNKRELSEISPSETLSAPENDGPASKREKREERPEVHCTDDAVEVAIMYNDIDPLLQLIDSLLLQVNSEETDKTEKRSLEKQITTAIQEILDYAQPSLVRSLLLNGQVAREQIKALVETYMISNAVTHVASADRTLLVDLVNAHYFDRNCAVALAVDLGDLDMLKSVLSPENQQKVSLNANMADAVSFIDCETAGGSIGCFLIYKCLEHEPEIGKPLLDYLVSIFGAEKLQNQMTEFSLKILIHHCSTNMMYHAIRHGLKSDTFPAAILMCGLRSPSDSLDLNADVPAKLAEMDGKKALQEYLDEEDQFDFNACVESDRPKLPASFAKKLFMSDNQENEDGEDVKLENSTEYAVASCAYHGFADGVVAGITSFNVPRNSGTEEPQGEEEEDDGKQEEPMQEGSEDEEDKEEKPTRKPFVSRGWSVSVAAMPFLNGSLSSSQRVEYLQQLISALGPDVLLDKSKCLEMEGPPLFYAIVAHDLEAISFIVEKLGKAAAWSQQGGSCRSRGSVFDPANPAGRVDLALSPLAFAESLGPRFSKVVEYLTTLQ